MADLYPSAPVSAARSRVQAAAFAAPSNGSFAAMSKASQQQTSVRYALYDENETAAVNRFNSFDEPSTDLLMNETEEDKNDFRIAYDSIGRVASIAALPKDLGKTLALSAKNGNLHTQFCTRAQDISGKMPVGNHDLIKDMKLEVTTNMKQPFVAEYNTVYAHGDEHFYGNSAETNSRSVAHVFMPSDFENQTAIATVLSRPITTSMRMFLKRFPGQTVDTISEYVTDLKNTPNVLVRYSDRPGGISSAVTMWYEALVDDNGRRMHAPLVPVGDGTHASMPRDVYKQCEALARTEIAKYISLGDVTSNNFSITIRPLAANGKEGLGLSDFAYHHPTLDPMAKVVDPATGDLITALELFNKTPITFTLRSVATYKKVNDGTAL